jgi:hypothetical protein
MFLAMVRDRVEIESRMAEHLASYRRALTYQFDELFARAKPHPGGVEKPDLPGQNAWQGRAASG